MSDDDFDIYKKKCPTCGADFVNLKEEGKLTTFFYQCQHKVGLVVSNEIRQRTITSQVRLYAEKDLDDLYSELARLRDPTKLQVATAAVADFVNDGKERFEQFREELYKKLCIEYQLCSKLEQLEKLGLVDKTERIYYIIASLSVLVVPWYIPVAMLAAIVVKDGLGKFCNCT